MFYNKIVSDLNWVINSPAVFTDCCKSLHKIEYNSLFSPESCSISLIELDKNPFRLHDFLNSRNIHLIGKYFEVLLEFALINSISIEMIISNVQIKKRNRDTLGEIDFLYRDISSGKIIHLEAAGKFYLAYKNESNWENFIGPNPADNLRLKMDHLLNHQSVITTLPETRDYLHSIGITEKITQRVLLKGFIFYPYILFYSRNFIVPEFASEHHLKGWWLKLNEVSILENSTSRYAVLERKEWMVPAKKSFSGTLDASNLIMFVEKYFSSNNYPLLIVELCESSDLYLEVSRGFIVSNNWPHPED